MAITMFRTRRWSTEITPVQLTRFTELSVFKMNYSGTKELRQARTTDYDQYHASWEKARDFLLRVAEGSVQSARNELIGAEAFLGHVLDLKPPATLTAPPPGDGSSNAIVVPQGGATNCEKG